jgi:hypothetical protein
MRDGRDWQGTVGMVEEVCRAAMQKQRLEAQVIAMARGSREAASVQLVGSHAKISLSFIDYAGLGFFAARRATPA